MFTDLHEIQKTFDLLSSCHDLTEARSMDRCLKDVRHRTKSEDVKRKKGWYAKLTPEQKAARVVKKREYRAKLRERASALEIVPNLLVTRTLRAAAVHSAWQGAAEHEQPACFDGFKQTIETIRQRQLVRSEGLHALAARVAAKHDATRPDVNDWAQRLASDLSRGRD